MEETSYTKVKFEIDNGDGTFEVETLWAVSLGNNLYRLDNLPFFAYGVSWSDIVEARIENANDVPVFQRVVTRSGNKTVRINFETAVQDGSVPQKILDILEEKGCSCEAWNARYIAINIPAETDLFEIRDFLEEQDVNWEHANPKYAELYSNQ